MDDEDASEDGVNKFVDEFTAGLNEPGGFFFEIDFVVWGKWYVRLDNQAILALLTHAFEGVTCDSFNPHPIRKYLQNQGIAFPGDVKVRLLLSTSLLIF